MAGVNHFILTTIQVYGISSSMKKEPTPQELTPRQTLVYDFIHSYIEEHQASPSFREIAAHFDLSIGAIQDHVEGIRRKGYLQKREAKARGISVPIKRHQVPVLGQVHAGPLHMAFENVEGHLPVGKTLAPTEHFALKIKGDSMSEAGILEGDWVIVRIQATAEEGDIVVARLEDETTVKYFKRKGEKAFLQPANSNYKPITGVPFSIVGVVVELRRKYGR